MPGWGDDHVNMSLREREHQLREVRQAPERSERVIGVAIATAVVLAVLTRALGLW